LFPAAMADGQRLSYARPVALPAPPPGADAARANTGMSQATDVAEQFLLAWSNDDPDNLLAGAQLTTVAFLSVGGAGSCGGAWLVGPR
jgi:hypothetical protein